jgi:hypothetical protein
MYLSTMLAMSIWTCYIDLADTTHMYLKGLQPK